MSAKLIFAIAATLLSWTSACCTVHYFWQFFRDQGVFIKVNTRADHSNRVLSWAYVAFVLIGVGYCIFRGAEATLQFIPKSWRSFEAIFWIGDDIAGVVAFFGSFLLLDQMTKLAKTIQDLKRKVGAPP